MKTFSLGFIGAGNMAQAIFSGAINKHIIQPSEVFIFDVSDERMKYLSAEYGVNAVDSIKNLSAKADILVLAVKPNILPSVCDELSKISAKNPLVSIVAGWSAMKIKGHIKQNIEVLRIMPNTPLQYGEGMSAFEVPTDVNEEEYLFIKSVFQSLGLVLDMPEKLMDAVTAVSGSGPAYVFMFIEALADAAVLNGITRNDALVFAAQTVLGSAKTVLESGLHPAALKDAVCSPGGTTIEAVKVLEAKGFRSAVIEAVNACADKSKKL